MLRVHITDFILTDRGARWRFGPVALLRMAFTWADQFLCGLRGHAMVRHVEGRTLRLQCLACGARTPGWTLDGRPPR